MAKKLIRALILAIALGQIIRIPLLSGAFITPLDVIAGFLFLVWVSNSNFLKARLFLPIFLFAGIGFISLLLNSKHLMSDELLVSFMYLVRWVILVGVYFVVRDFDQKTKQTLLYWLAAAGVLTAVLGLVQYFLYPDLRNLYYLEWDEHLYRVFSTFLDPNFAGAFFVLTFILLLGLFVDQKKKNTLPGFILVGALTLTFLALLFTYSRSAFLMFIISTSVFLISLGKKASLLVLLGFFMIGFFLLPKNLPSEGVNLTRVASILARQESVEKTLTIFKDQPILGVGFNAYRYAQKRYGFLEEKSWQVIHSGAGTDNSFLFVLATTGIVGFGAFLYLWYRILRLAYSLKEELISKIVIASTLGLFISSLFINSLFYESILVWMWILIGIMEKR